MTRTNGAAQDPVAAAIEKVDGQPAPDAPELTQQITVKIGLGEDRAGVLVLPADVSAGEWLAIIAYLTGTVAPPRARRAQGGG